MGRTYVELDLRDLRSLVGVLSEGVADLDGLGLLHRRLLTEQRHEYQHSKSGRGSG